MTAGELLDMCQWLIDHTPLTEDVSADTVESCVAEIEANNCGLAEIGNACANSGLINCGPPCDDLGTLQACVDAGSTNCFFAAVAGC